MNRILFIIVLLMMVCPLWAQEFVLEKVNTSIYRDTCAYHEKGFYEVLKDYNNDIGSGLKYLYHDTMANSSMKFNMWLNWLFYRVVARDLWPILDSCQEWGLWRSVDYQGLAIEFFYDEKGTILTANFYVDEEIRDKIVPRLKEIHEALMKEKIPKEFMEKINLLKKTSSDKSLCNTCFREFICQTTIKKREYLMTEEPSWPARKAEFDSISDSNNREKLKKKP